MQTLAETDGYEISKGFPLWLPLLLFAAFVPTAIEWYRHAPNYLTYDQSRYADHWSHAPWLLMHILGATVPLFVGPLLLWSGLRERYLKLHRLGGRLYLILGSIGVAGGLIISVIAPDEPRSLYISTFALAVVWYGAAFMAYRAVRNYRIEQHREWVIRSYVLTFTFVNCRLASEIQVFPWLGLENITAVIWLGWTIPLFITEIFLQWRKGAAIN